MCLRDCGGTAGDTIGRLAVDTGATSTIISWDIAVLLGYDPAVEAKRVQITTGSGVEFVPRIQIAMIQALGHEHRNFDILCHTLPPSASVDGLIGLDFFRNTRLVIDFKKGTIGIE